MTTILVTEFIDEDALRAFPADWTVRYEPTLVDDRGALLVAAPTVDAVIVRNRTQVDAGLLEAAPRLRAVGRLGVGLDNIDVPACEARGIAVLPATGANAASVAEYVIGVALSLVRGAFGAADAIASGAWPRAELGRGSEIGGRTLGLLGAGLIAREVAVRGAALGMRVIAHDPFVHADASVWGTMERVEFDALIERSDLLSLHVPLTDGTRDLVDRAVLGRMKPSAVLVNTARGGIVDETALIAALRDGRLGGAALDVFADEPPNEPNRFADVPNLILTPHIAGVTREANERVSALTVKNVMRALGESEGRT